MHAQVEFFTLFNVAVKGLLGEPSTFKRQYENPILQGQDAGGRGRQSRKGG